MIKKVLILLTVFSTVPALLSGQNVQGLIPVPARVYDTAMGEDGTLYLVSEQTIHVLEADSQATRPLSLSFIRTMEEGAATFDRHWFHSIAFSGTEPLLLWTTRTGNQYASYVTSLNSQTTVTLQKPLIARGLAISPDGDFFALGEGPNSSFGIHRFSSAGRHLQSFHEGSEERAAKLRGTDTSIFVIPFLPGNSIVEYSFTGQLQRTYNFDQVMEPGKIGVVRGAFVKNGTLYVDTVPGERHSHTGEDCGPGGGDCAPVGISTDTSHIYRLENGQMVFESTGQADIILYGITVDEKRVGRSLNVTTRGSLAIEAGTDGPVGPVGSTD